MLLKNLPDLFYNIAKSPVDVHLLHAKNLWQRSEVLPEFINSITLFDEYIVRNGETPETISNGIYGTPFYNWTLLIANDIVNYYEQWPKSTLHLNQFVSNKYKNPQATKHYVTTEVKNTAGNIIIPAGKVVPSNYSVSYIDNGINVTANPVVSITNYQYEEEINGRKEKIKIIRPSLIADFVETYYRRINKNGIMTVANTAFEIKM
jgi:hypothetical protein